MSPTPVISRLRNRRAAEQYQRAAGPNRPTTRSRPPYNPGLHKLVAEKQEWAEPLDAEAKARGFLGWHQRGYLPHYDAPGTMQLVTFRLDDALPASRRSEWAALMEIEDNRERRRKLEAYVDMGRGECWLRQPRLAQLTESALRFFAGERYRLAAWVVMPNHVHVLVEVWQTPLAELVKSWKQFTARKANRVLGRDGTFWAREYWETRIADEAHQIKAVRYIEANPVKEGLVREAKDWPWSSARFRDGFGRLTVPPRRADFQSAYRHVNPSAHAMNPAPVQSRFGNRRAARWTRYRRATWLLAFACVLHASTGQDESPDFPLDTRWDYQVGVGWADSGAFRLETRFSGSTGAGMSGVFTLDTRGTPDALASLAGQVTDAGGQPLSSATIVAEQGTGRPAGTYTDAAGRFQLAGLAPGTWQVWVSRSGYRTWVQSGVTLVPGQAGALSVALAPVPALPNVTATDQPVAKTQEAQIVPTTDQQLEVFNGSAFVQGELVDRALPTVIFTHGWNSGPTAWAQAMAAQMIAANIKANLLAWDWKTQADTLEPIEAMSSTRRQGEALGKALAATLGDSCAGTLHFIGHSLGTLVNATAANYLHGLRNNGVAMFPADHTQMTLLDDAGAVNAAGKVVTFGYKVSGMNGSIASQLVQAGFVSPVPNDAAWIDNYISLVGSYHGEAVNVLLPKSAVLADPKDPITYHIERHAYACSWYRQTVLLPTQVLLGYRYALERTGWPGQFPTPSPYEPGSLLSQVLEDDNELHLFQVTREEELDSALSFANKWEILATGASSVNWVVSGYVDLGKAIFNTTRNAVVSAAESLFRSDPAANLLLPAETPDFQSASTGTFLPLSPRIDLTTAGSTPPRQLAGPRRADEPTATNTPPAVWMTLTLPAEVRGMSFDFTLTGGVGSDDYLAFGIDGTNRFALETRFMEPNRTVSIGWIDVSEYAGHSVEFFFGVLGGTSTNVTLAVDGLRFYQTVAPQLDLARSGGDVVLHWPADSGDFILETATTLAPAPDWSPVNATPALDGGFFSVTNAMTDGARFFRLRQSN